jgi:hypothetical protein
MSDLIISIFSIGIPLIPKVFPIKEGKNENTNLQNSPAKIVAVLKIADKTEFNKIFCLCF